MTDAEQPRPPLFLLSTFCLSSVDSPTSLSPPTVTYPCVSKRVDAVEKGVPIIEIVSPKSALRSLRILSRHRCSVRLSFSTASVEAETFRKPNKIRDLNVSGLRVQINRREIRVCPHLDLDQNAEISCRCHGDQRVNTAL